MDKSNHNRLLHIIKVITSPKILYKSIKVKSFNIMARPTRKFLEKIGIDYLSKPYGIDGNKKHDLLMNYVNFQDGFFIEIGGHDGYFHSPTYYLEAMLGWQGILVEPIPELAARCKKERQRSSVYNFACVASNSSEPFVEMVDCGHSSHVNNSIDEDQPWITDIQKNLSQEDKVLKVRAVTLSDLLDKHFESHGKREIDLFVLDVEGYELTVLDGLDFNIYGPKYLLIECHNEEQFKKKDAYLAERSYALVEKISHNDYLYEQKTN